MLDCDTLTQTKPVLSGKISLANKCFFFFYLETFTTFRSAHSLSFSPARFEQSLAFIYMELSFIHLHNVFQAITHKLLYSHCSEQRLVCICFCFCRSYMHFTLIPHVIASKFSAGYSCAIKTFQNKCAIMPGVCVYFFLFVHGFYQADALLRHAKKKPTRFLYAIPVP